LSQNAEPGQNNDARKVKTPFRRLADLDWRSGTTLIALALAALVPAACVLWFMTAAMRNERLAVKQRLTGVYLSHLTSLQRQLTTFWRNRQTALQAVAKAAPGETFAAIVRSNLADSVVVYDQSGKLLYPALASPELSVQAEERDDWAAAEWRADPEGLRVWRLSA
jgi:hypothetical protein